MSDACLNQFIAGAMMSQMLGPQQSGLYGGGGYCPQPQYQPQAQQAQQNNNGEVLRKLDQMDNKMDKLQEKISQNTANIDKLGQAVAGLVQNQQAMQNQVNMHAQQAQPQRVTLSAEQHAQFQAWQARQSQHGP